MEIEVVFSSVPKGLQNLKKGERCDILSMRGGRLRVIRHGDHAPVEYWFTWNKEGQCYDPDEVSD